MMMDEVKAVHSGRDNWVCPACARSEGSSGPFVSDWALSCHVAGKIHAGDRLHRSWALSKIPNLDVKATLPRMAERLMWPIIEAQKERDTLGESLQNHPALDLYHKLSTIEMRLHEYIKYTLEKEFGRGEDEWWAKGVPLPVRQECVKRREEDVRRQDPYAYTDLIDLQRILDKDWRLFEINFQCISRKCGSKKEFLDNFVRLNEIRKVIMHPVRQPEELSDDAQFCDWFGELIQEFVSRD